MLKKKVPLFTYIIIPKVVTIPGIQSSIPGDIFLSGKVDSTVKPSINVHQPKVNCLMLLIHVFHISQCLYQETSQINGNTLSFITKRTTTANKDTNVIIHNFLLLKV